MSESRSESRVFNFDHDPQMQAACANARATFKYFWREVAWERRRIVPALDNAVVKAPFTDGEQRRESGHPQVEEMWIAEVDFDGDAVSGVLLNSPSWLRSVKAGDKVRLSLEKISDWLIVCDGEPYGGYTIQIMRSRMGLEERQEHDAACGMKFGDPHKIRVTLRGEKSGSTNGEDEGMGAAGAESLKESLIANPSWVTGMDDRGWTLLHQESLAGNWHTVEVLLAHGAKIDAVTPHGKTPLQLARSLGWEKVIALLESNGAK